MGGGSRKQGGKGGSDYPALYPGCVAAEAAPHPFSGAPTTLALGAPSNPTELQRPVCALTAPLAGGRKLWTGVAKSKPEQACSKGILTLR
jgi:hypothetical protein